jgi:hypothetical protein
MKFLCLRERKKLSFFLNKAANRQDERKLHMKYWWNFSEREKEVLGEKSVSTLLRLPQIPHGLTWDRTCFSAMRSRQLRS